MIELWVGKEKYGINKGLRTLYVGSKTITFREITNAIKKYNIEHIYLGAGRCSEPNMDIISKCLTLKITVTLEVSKLRLCYYRKFYDTKLNFIVTINGWLFTKELCDNPKTQYKMQNLEEGVGLLCNYNPKNFIDNSEFTGIYYNNDTILKGELKIKKRKRISREVLRRR